MKLMPLLGKLALVSCGACSQARDADIPRPPNVIVICMDTVRADHLGCYGYAEHPTTPRLDALAAEATLFEDASAVAGWTKPSVPSFLTGTYPLQHGVYEGSARGEAGKVSDVLPAAATTLAEVFQSERYATAAFIRNAQLKRGNGFEQGFETYADDAGDAREIRWRAEDWLEERDAARPFFLYLHFLDAHWPYAVPDEYAGHFTPLESTQLFRGGDSRALRDAINDGERTLDAGELAALRALYDGALRSIDDQLAQLFAYLERRGVWDDTIVCVIADHGEEFLEHGRIGHGHGLYENLLRVPWILRIPGHASERVATPVSLIDLFPTVLAAAGVRGAPRCEGVDRLSDRSARPILAEHKEPGAYQQSLRATATKLVRRFGAARARPAAAEPAPLELGLRFEAELDPDSPLEPRARRVTSRENGPAELLELKGTLTRLDGEWLEVAGFRARISAATELYGNVSARPAGASALTVGAPLKIVGAVEAGELWARRIKLYGPDESAEPELRGSLTAFEGARDAGRLQCGGLWISVDARTRWELGEPAHGAAELSREDVLAFVDAPENRDGSRVRAHGYDLSRDPRELAPLDSESCAQLLRTLDASGRALAARRLFSDGDRTLLDAGALDALRELGYVR